MRRLLWALDSTTTVVLVYAAGVATGWIVFSALGGLGDIVQAITDALK